MPRPRSISTKELSDTSRADAISEAQLDMTWSNDFMLSVKYTGKKNQCNLTALHKGLLCRDISFLPVYFCLGCRESFSRPRGSRAGENNVGIQGGNCTCCLFSTVSAVTPQEAASLQTISYVNIIIQCRQVRKHLLYKSPTWPRILLRWKLQNQQCHGCEPLQNTGLMCRIKMKLVLHSHTYLHSIVPALENGLAAPIIILL